MKSTPQSYVQAYSRAVGVAPLAPREDPSSPSSSRRRRGGPPATGWRSRPGERWRAGVEMHSELR